ncbi:MAG: hypothetical protein CM1200mP31_1000 [Candidatus Neomarinimicrobiota bacterium]|nr:MAG: hypothetical protein CM1200mP31_1000 [Candidatus Neomarinimicrobiota bacterium]
MPYYIYLVIMIVIKSKKIMFQKQEELVSEFANINVYE